MEQGKLNLNAPLLSVRRIATTPVSTARDNEKIVRTPDGRHTLPPSKSDFCLEQVTEPVAVPFHWEHIPGKSKEGNEQEPQPPEEAAVTPRLPPGKLIEFTKQTLERDHADQNGISPRFKPCSLDENVNELKRSKELINERGALEVEDEDDDYSDALETISPTRSFSLNCSASGLSQSDGTDVKPSRAFSMDPQTLDMMMSRFLPAAKAMALETPHYAAKKQYTVPEQPTQVARVIRKDTSTLSNAQGSHMELQSGQDKEEEESEGEDDEYYDPSGPISAKGCGLFPRLCLRNSLCLLSPIPGMKARPRTLMSSSSGVVRPEKSTYGRSHSQPLNKHAWDAAYKPKSKCGSQSAELQKLEHKQAGERSRFTRSGELKKGRSSPLRHSRSACISPYQAESPCGVQSAELQKFEHKKAGESSRFTHSGDLKKGKSSPFRNSRSPCISPYRYEARCGVQSAELLKLEHRQTSERKLVTHSGDLNKDRSSPFRHSRSACISPYRNDACGVQSAELQKLEHKQAGEHSRLTQSGDLSKGRSSPFRHSRSSCISPYRNEAPKSPFPGVGFLGIPREESVKANSKFDLHDKGGHNFQAVLSHQRSTQGPRSESPTIEKTLYVDTVNTAKLSCSNSSFFDTKQLVDSAGEDFGTLIKRREMEESSTAEFLFQDIKCLNSSKGSGTLEPEALESFADNFSSLSDISHFKGQEVAMEDSQLGLGQEIESLHSSKLSANGNLDMICSEIIKADSINVDNSSVQSPLPPPLPRSPSESWLWSTISSISSRHSVSQVHTKRLDSKTSSTSTKWETIVKTSNLRHDHVRYSEELITPVFQQYKS